MQAGGLVVSHHNTSHPLTSHTSNAHALEAVNAWVLRSLNCSRAQGMVQSQLRKKLKTGRIGAAYRHRRVFDRGSIC